MKTSIIALFSLALTFCCCADPASFPVILSPTVDNTTVSGSCPLVDRINEQLHKVQELLRETVNPILDKRYGSPTCQQCKGDGWISVASLNMSNPDSECFSGWTYYATPLRACGRSSTNNVATAVVPVNGLSYTQVCGQVIGYQKGNPNAFGPTLRGFASGIEDSYIDGVSVTHGTAGSRQHIWSFVAAYSDNGTNSRSRCPCGNGYSWPHTASIPSFVGANYFCDTGNPGTTRSLLFDTFPNNPMWDGVGCSAYSTCCQDPNQPIPYFTSALQAATSDDIDLRITANMGVFFEDIRVTTVDVCIK